MTLFSSIQTDVFKKNVIYVRVSPDGKTIVLEDENGQGGGNVLGAENRKVTWINDASFTDSLGTDRYFTCKLTFNEMFRDTDDAYGGPLWPFHPEQPTDPGCVVTIAAKTPEGVQSKWSGHLKKNNDVKYYKYDVELIPTNGAPAPTPIDPMVIIED